MIDGICFYNVHPKFSINNLRNENRDCVRDCNPTKEQRTVNNGSSTQRKIPHPETCTKIYIYSENIRHTKLFIFN